LTIHNKRNGVKLQHLLLVAESDEIIDDVEVAATNIRCFAENNGSLVINGVTGGVPPYTYTWAPVSFLAAHR
jgi:hypothetical protein